MQYGPKTLILSLLLASSGALAPSSALAMGRRHSAPSAASELPPPDAPDEDLLTPFGKPSDGYDLVPLHFTNRAQCAIESQDPTHSTFVLIDGYDAGKLAHSIALATGRDPVELSKQGMLAFRLTVTEMIARIAADLIKGRLPLLPAGDDPADRLPKRYRELLGQCKNGDYCTALDPYLAEVWENAHRAPAHVTPWEKLDTFESSHFLAAGSVEHIGCHYLKRFSPLQSHLDAVTPDGAVLANIAQAAIAWDELIGHCLDPSAELSSRYASVQLDLLGLPDPKRGNDKRSSWNHFGFDFWNSVKIYFSWGWRNLPRLSRYSEPFDFAFRSIPVEEAVMLMPNGCMSIERPACDSRTLSTNSLRDFGRASNAGADPTRFLPQGAQKDLTKDPTPEINDDLLGMKDSKDAEEWLKGFRDRMTGTRGDMKRRFLNAVTTMNLMVQYLTPERIESDVQKMIASPPKENDPAWVKWKNQIYYLCSEFTLAHHAEMSVIRKDLTVLDKAHILDDLAVPFTKESVQGFYEYYARIADKMMPICTDLEKSRFWDGPNGGFVGDPSGFSAWYKEAIQSDAAPDQPGQEPYYQGDPLLTYKAYDLDWSPDHVICYSGIDCARRSLRAAVDFLAVLDYADAFMPMADNLQAPDAFNPYAERDACKVYDPWFKTRASIKTLLADLGNAALFGWNMVPAYIDVSVKPGEVTSIDTLVKDGKLTFNPKRTKDKAQVSFIADLGSLTGVPCMVSVSQAVKNPLPFYALDGLMIGACFGKEKHKIQVTSGSDIGPDRSHGGSACLSCYLSLRTITNLAAFTPYTAWVKTGIYLLGAGIRFYKNMQDPVNVPHARNVKVAYVVESYRSHGNKITKHCVHLLSKGKRCVKRGYKPDNAKKAIRFVDDVEDEEETP